jgi:chromosome segregation protein
LYFKRLEMQGFKSFADPVTIDFHEGITCIVGPNGSGKSNISDAIRWVLGEQSAKTLRSGRMEEVIFAGTARRKARGMAEVTLVIDNSAAILPIDYQEVAITRRMFRSGESEYLINRAPCRLRDVRELILDTGIGVDGYSIIGQGRISDIVASKAENRREMFEEAAGIVKYRNRRDEAERRLASARQNLERIDDIIAEVGSRIGGLRDESIRAVEYLELKEKQKLLEIGVTLKNIETIELKSEYLKDELLEAANRIEEAQEIKATVDQEWQTVRDQADQIEQTAESIRDRLNEVGERINRLDSEKQLTAERLRNLTRDKERLELESEAFQAKIKTVEGELAECLAEQTIANAEAQKSQDELQLLADDCSAMETAVTERTIQADREQAELFEIHRRLSEITAEQNGLGQLAESIRKRRAQLEADNESRQSAAEELTVKEKQAAERLAEYETTASRLRQEGAALDTEIGSVSKQLTDHRVQLNQLAIEQGEAVARHRLLREMEASFEGYQSGVRHIMKSGIAGLVGVAADLITVPAGYEAAFEAALGGNAQNIICRTEQTARDGVASLKQHKAGRLTFLPLDSLRPRPAATAGALKGKAGYLGLASDLAQYDPLCRPAIEYLLGRTAIVEDLVQAVELSRSQTEGLRIVTLEGDLVNPAGAITGGKAKHKTDGIFERKAEITRLGKQTERLESELTELRRQTADLEGRLNELRREKETSEQAYHNADADQQLAAQELSRLQTQRLEIETTAVKIQGEIGLIDEEVDRALHMQNELEQELQAQKQRSVERAELSEQLRANLEEERRQLAEKTRLLSDQRLHANDKLNQATQLAQAVDRLESSIAEWQEEIRQRSEQLERQTAEEALFAESAGPLEEELAKSRNDQVEWQRQSESLIAQRTLLAQRDKELVQRRAEIDERLLAEQTLKYETDVKLAQNEVRIEGYKEKLWEDYELSYIQAIAYQKQDFQMSSAQRELKQLRERLNELGEVNVGAIKEYEQVTERHSFLTEQRTDLTEGMDSLETIIRELEQTIKQRFMEQFQLIGTYFSEAFQALFGGGQAELQLDDPAQPLESGVDIVAQPPGKKLQNIQLLSGGEKTLTAIALMFAVLKARPTPFCILDEVEAALDDMNIQRFAEYLRKFEEIQFVLVTHQKATMEYADALYGVTMPEHGISELISLRLGDEILV